MNERLLTPEIHAETIRALLILQDAKSRAATLRECGEWLAAYLKDNSGGILWASDHIGVITQLERGEAPWEVKP